MRVKQCYAIENIEPIPSRLTRKYLSKQISRYLDIKVMRIDISIAAYTVDEILTNSLEEGTVLGKF